MFSGFPSVSASVRPGVRLVGVMSYTSTEGISANFGCSVVRRQMK